MYLIALSMKAFVLWAVQFYKVKKKKPHSVTLEIYSAQIPGYYFLHH